MSISLHDISIAQVIPSVKTVVALLQKGEAWAKEQGIDPQTLLDARLSPDMAPLIRQVQFVSDTAKGAGARLAGLDNPVFPDEEKTFTELQERLAKTLAFLETATPERVNGNEDKEIVLKFGPEFSVSFTGTNYALQFVTPNLLFHVVTAYDILRSKGVPLAKGDYLKRA